MCRQIARWQKIASPVMIAPSRGNPLSRAIAAVISFWSGSTTRSPTTAPSSLAKADSTCSGLASSRRLPFNVLPSMAMCRARSLAEREFAERRGECIGVERLEEHSGYVAWQGATPSSMPSRRNASGFNRRPQRKIAIRSLAPASMAAIAMPSTDGSLYCRPFLPRRSCISQSASHKVLRHGRHLHPGDRADQNLICPRCQPR